MSTVSQRMLAVMTVLVVMFLFLSWAAGHPELRHSELTVVGHLNVGAGPGNITDLWAHKSRDGRAYAYLGTFDEPYCSPEITGVYVVDITDAARPSNEGFIQVPPGTYVSDVKVAKVETAFFEGDVLAHSLEFCRGEDGEQA